MSTHTDQKFTCARDAVAIAERQEMIRGRRDEDDAQEEAGGQWYERRKPMEQRNMDWGRGKGKKKRRVDKEIS